MDIAYNQLDIALNEYYERYGRDDWYDGADNNDSVVLRYVTSHQLHEELRFNSNPMDCGVTKIDNFPFPKNMKVINEYQQRAFIFYILRWYWDGNNFPEEESMFHSSVNLINGN